MMKCEICGDKAHKLLYVKDIETDESKHLLAYCDKCDSKLGSLIYELINERMREKHGKRAIVLPETPVNKGKWKWISCTTDRIPREVRYGCSECKHETIVHGDELPWEKYCPSCGARMLEE